MNPKLNPYQYLLEEIRRFCLKLTAIHTVSMWQYPKAKLNQQGGWALGDLWDRTAAAQQLGYEVILSAKDEGLLVQYRKKMPAIPSQWE